jgi:uncharacterized membrane protein
MERMEIVNKILIAIFPSEKAAYKGVAALKDLHEDGDISLYASSVIAKDAAGALAVRQAADSGPLGTLVGIVAGSLVGLLGGPAGAVVGGWIGGGAGLAYDLFSVGVGVDFIDEVGTFLTPGKVAVVADIEESWSTPVDAWLVPIGATLFRRYPGEVADDQLAREAEAAEAEMRQLDAELDHAEGEASAKIHAEMASQRARLQAIVDRADAAIKQEKTAVEARLATLHAQLESVREEQRKRIETRIYEAKIAHTTRQTKFEEARAHAKAAVELIREAIRT